MYDIVLLTGDYSEREAEARRRGCATWITRSTSPQSIPRSGSSQRTVRSAAGSHGAVHRYTTSASSAMDAGINSMRSCANRQIAAHMYISPETVKYHLHNIFSKYRLKSRTQLQQTLKEWDFSAWEQVT